MYKLSKEYDAQNYCDKANFNGVTIYLILDKDGESLQKLAEPFYNILKMLMDHKSLTDMLIRDGYIKNE